MARSPVGLHQLYGSDKPECTRNYLPKPEAVDDQCEQHGCPSLLSG